MGVSITWCAVPEQEADRFFARLGLSPTGETEEIPESPICAGKLDTGWRIVWYNRYGCPFLRPADLRELSKDHQILLCLVEEHVMASSAELWSGGRREWWISHQGESGPKGLDLDGRPPESLAAIRREMEQARIAAGGDDADADYIFEIPLKVAESIVGFKHDENWPHLVENRFIVLSREASRKGFFRRLFGGG